MRCAVVLTHDPELAADLVQDVLTRAFLSWSSIGQLDFPYAYLRRMIVNAFISHQRKWSRWVPTPADDLDSVAQDPTDSYAERDALLQRLDRLPAQQRAAVVLRYFEDMSFDNIAETLNCRPATARGYVHRALATLRIEVHSSVTFHPSRSDQTCP